MQSARPLIVERILQADLGFKKVLGVSNAAAILQQSFSPPSCFVWRSATRANPETMDAGAVLQAVRVDYGLIIVLKQEKDQGETEDQAELLSDQIMGLLLGWMPFSGEQQPMLYSGGAAIPDLERNLLLWRDTYSLTQYITAPYS